MKRTILLWSILFCSISAEILSDTVIPCRIQVQPVFFITQGEAEPTREQQFKLQKHILLAQTCYRKMLNGEDTFEISEKGILIHRSQHPLEFYKNEGKMSTCLPVSELFAAYGYNRFTCPYIYVIVFMNSKEDFPAGGGRPFNRGFNNGGGLVYLSSHGLDNSHFQSTLLHELGHSFGLVHIDAYGYDMNANLSIMSYNKDNWWDGFKVKELET